VFSSTFFYSPRLSLQGSRLRYYKDEKSHLPLGVINLGLCRGIKKVQGSSKGTEFVIMTSHRVYYISAESSAEMQSWMDALADGVPDDPTPRIVKKSPTTADDLVTFSISVSVLFCSVLLFSILFPWSTKSKF